MVNTPVNPRPGDWLFRTTEEHDLMASGISYQLTFDTAFAAKVKLFLLRLSDPHNGFPVTRRGCNQASVQEGHFFQHIAMAYDMVLPSGIFSEADRQQIDHTLRLFVDSDPGGGGQISNWNVSSLTGGLYCALVLQDLAAANQFLYAPGGIIDQLREGTLDDGWWYEVSISYNTWVATEFSQVAIAMRPWGVNLADMKFPAAYRQSKQRIPAETEYGITDARWGPIHHNWIGIKRMWDVLPEMVDYRGIMFGLNDATERKVTGEAMEIAYYLYRDPAYVSVIKRGGGQRDLIYGVPELPDNTPDLSARSTYADNAGVAVLRSQSAGKEPGERIQAVLRYGDHGWYHGHFDRTDMVHLSRYGRSFFNPEMIWYGYPSFMYKFYVQTSVSKNMVVVDQKQQEPAENQRILFYAGKMMQVAAVQTSSRWSNPPYGGIVYDDQTHVLRDKLFNEGRSIPIPDNHPPYVKGKSVTGYTEPILQRRLMIVTDDYVVLADYLRGEKEHIYESLYQMKALQGLEAASKKLQRHTAQWNPDPIGSAQFVTDCDWYAVAAPVRGSFQFRYGPGADNAGNNTQLNEPGVLNMDVHSLWPLKQELMMGTPPETHAVEKRVYYTVQGDGKTLVNDSSGIWILGEKQIDIPVKGIQVLELRTKANRTDPATLFWANARIVTAAGKEISLQSLLKENTSAVSFENTKTTPGAGKDFYGGPLKVSGIAYGNAVSAQPEKADAPSVVKVDLGRLNAVRFKAVLGGDFPLGDESQRRKTVAFGVKGKEARFLSLIEPFEDKRMVRSVVALSADMLRVELMDGRVQEISIEQFEGAGNDVKVKIRELKEGKEVRTEITH